VTRAPSLEPLPETAEPEAAEPDSADTIVKPPVLIEPPLEQRAAPARDPYASHGAWPASEGGLPGRSTAAPVAEPPLVFGFRVGSSRTVTLDAIVYLGRRPSAPRIVRGGIPRLVRVHSETNEVSSTHVELRQTGRTVVVTDMRSTNGTTVQLPGYPARRLRQGESVVVTAGTMIDIGDKNVIEILRLAADEGTDSVGVDSVQIANAAEGHA